MARHAPSGSDAVAAYIAAVADAASTPIPNTPEGQYRLIRDGLLDRGLPPGAVLLESTISRYTGASRTPVRQALTRLELEGFLERRTRGWQVRIGSPEEIIEIYETRAVLEGFAARLAARNRTDLDLARLQQVDLLISDASTGHPAVHELNRTWHDAVWSASRNETVRSLLHGLTSQLRVLEVGGLATADNLRLTADEHSAVLAAIVARDESAAEHAMIVHLQRTRGLRVQFFADQAAGSP